MTGFGSFLLEMSYPFLGAVFLSPCLAGTSPMTPATDFVGVHPE